MYVSVCTDTFTCVSLLIHLSLDCTCFERKVCQECRPRNHAPHKQAFTALHYGCRILSIYRPEVLKYDRCKARASGADTFCISVLLYATMFIFIHP